MKVPKLLNAWTPIQLRSNTVQTDNTTVAKPIVVEKIKYTPKEGEFFITNNNGEKILVLPKLEVVSADNRSAFLRKQDEKRSEELYEQYRLEQGKENAARFVNGVVTLLSPSTYIGAATRDNGKSYSENVASGEGFGDNTTNLIFDLALPFAFAKGLKFFSSLSPLALKLGPWRYLLPTGEGVYLRQGGKGIIDDAINRGVVAPETYRNNLIRQIQDWNHYNKEKAEKGMNWLKENPNASLEELEQFYQSNKPKISLLKHFDTNYMFNAGTPFYPEEVYKYTIIGTDRPEILWRTIRHKGHKSIREPFVPGAENRMGVPTEYMEGYYTRLPFGLGQWFRRFPKTKAPKEYYAP